MDPQTMLDALFGESSTAATALLIYLVLRDRAAANRRRGEGRHEDDGDRPSRRSSDNDA